MPKDFVVPKSPERILFCGWRRDIEDMIMVTCWRIQIDIHKCSECSFACNGDIYSERIWRQNLLSQYFNP